MSPQTKICPRCGQTRPPPSNPEEPRAYEKKDDSKLCMACDQPRPYPTRPGSWQYRSDSQGHWIPVRIDTVDGELNAILESEAKPLNEFGEGYGQWRKLP